MKKDSILDGSMKKYSVEQLKLARSQRSTQQNRAAVEITAGVCRPLGPSATQAILKIIKN